MSKTHPVLSHLALSLIALIISLGISFLTLLLTQDIFTYPQRYFVGNLSAAELRFMIVSISGVLVSVSISVVIYLFLTSRTRTQLLVWTETRWLAISLEQFRRLYDSAPVPYIMLNSTGEIHEPNKAALRLFEVVQDEIEGKNLFSFHLKEDLEQAEKLFEHYKRNIPINREEIRIVTKSGAKKWVLLSIFEMRNPASRTRTGLATLFDITEQKRLDQAKTEFVSLASHQLRTPLATVKWYTDMLLSGGIGELPPKQKDYVARLYAVNKDMIDLVETLLNVSRLEIGTFPIDLKPTNVRELSESILEELAPQIAKKRLRIVKQYKNFLDNIKSDPKLLRIVIQNLISNAIKYTPEEGSVIITFEESPNERRIIVSDTGFGIPKNQQDQIFTKLFRAGNVRKLSSSQSTGLGLYLVKSIVDALGGNIYFTSEENKGSTFTVTI